MYVLERYINKDYYYYLLTLRSGVGSHKQLYKLFRLKRPKLQINENLTVNS